MKATEHRPAGVEDAVAGLGGFDVALDHGGHVVVVSLFLPVDVVAVDREVAIGNPLRFVGFEGSGILLEPCWVPETSFGLIFGYFGLIATYFNDFLKPRVPKPFERKKNVTFTKHCKN